MEWESGSDSDDDGQRRSQMYDRTEDNLDAWSDENEEEGEEEDMEGLR